MTMRRVYFLLPNLESARAVVQDLRRAGVEEDDMYVLAKEGMPLEDLPKTSLKQRTDAMRGLEIGVAGGGAAGLLAGLAALTLPGTGAVLAGGALAYTALAGAGVGGAAGTLIGLAYPDQRLLKFESAIHRGEILMLVDTPEDQVPEIEEVVKQHHPEAEFGGTDPTRPPLVVPETKAE